MENGWQVQRHTFHSSISRVHWLDSIGLVTWLHRIIVGISWFMKNWFARNGAHRRVI